MTNIEPLRPRGPASPAEAFRQTPQNIEAEQALLGAILVNNEAFYRVCDFLSADHFFDAVHQRIYTICDRIIRAGKVATPITLKTFMESETKIGEMTVPQYLARLAAEATTVINAADFGHMIYDLALRRQLITIGEDMVNAAYDSPIDLPPTEQIETVENQLYKLAETGKYDKGFEPFTEALKNAMDMVNRAYMRSGHLSGISTGLSKMDKWLGGLQPSDLLILAGRPGMGKTALATNIAFNVAKAHRFETVEDGSKRTADGGIVAFFSLEMSAEQLAARIISEQTGISSDSMRKGTISQDDFATLVSVTQEIQQAPLYIDDTGGLTIAQLAARARRLKRQKGLDLLVVDYLQLLSGSGKRASDNRVQEITEITTGLKALAKELEAPIIALSQLSRQVESRDDKRPQLSDLRESGSIEQDADVVLFVYREEYYLKNKEPKPGSPEYLTWQEEMSKVHGRAEVIIGKQRHGPTGNFELQFDREVTRFSDLAEDDHLPQRFE